MHSLWEVGKSGWEKIGEEYIKLGALTPVFLVYRIIKKNTLNWGHWPPCLDIKFSSRIWVFSLNVSQFYLQETEYQKYIWQKSLSIVVLKKYPCKKKLFPKNLFVRKYINQIFIARRFPSLVALSLIKNIATGETSQAITPFHFFDNFNFHHKITFIPR